MSCLLIRIVIRVLAKHFYFLDSKESYYTYHHPQTKESLGVDGDDVNPLEREYRRNLAMTLSKVL